MKYVIVDGWMDRSKEESIMRERSLLPTTVSLIDTAVRNRLSTMLTYIFIFRSSISFPAAAAADDDDGGRCSTKQSRN